MLSYHFFCSDAGRGFEQVSVSKPSRGSSREIFRTATLKTQRRRRSNLPHRQVDTVSIVFLLSCLLSCHHTFGLPRNNRKENKSSANSLARLKQNNDVSFGQSRENSLTTFRDSFPCEAASNFEGDNNITNDDTKNISSPSTSSLNSASPFEGLLHLNPNQPSVPTRGGGQALVNPIYTGDPSREYDDNEIDQIVDDLIASVDGNDVTEKDDFLENNKISFDSFSNDEIEDDNDIGGQIPGDKNHHRVTIIDGSKGFEKVEESAISTKMEEVSVDSFNESSPSAANNSSTLGVMHRTEHSDHPQSSTSSINPSKTASATPQRNTEAVNTLPTNAYYRFLVRRGPKGHLIASLSLISVQWVYTYLPFVYRFVASLLLNCRIYDPKMLYIKERERILKLQRQRERLWTPSLSQKLKNKLSFSGDEQSLIRKAIQRQADMDATSKLRQLYKTMSTATLDLNEVRYRFLSVGFRRKHELGKDYKKKIPVVFMGETVAGDVETDDACGDGDAVFSDSEIDVVKQENINEAKHDEVKMLDQSRKRSRQKINDWVVQAFVDKHPSPSSASNGRYNSTSIPARQSTQSPSSTHLWKSAIKRIDILNAAWESRSVEKAVWTDDTIVGTKTRGESSSIKPGHTDRESYFGGSASKAFQSVMTRVGSNGRIPGAYPMDAPPIEECANEQGVLELARRYGYGDCKSKPPKDFPSLEADLKSQPSRRKKPRSGKSQSIPSFGVSGGADTSFRAISGDPPRQVTFQFDLQAASPRRGNRSASKSNAGVKSSLPGVRNTDIIRARLRELKSPRLVLTHDTLVKAPLQLLQSRLRHEKEED